jgi:hypothetical protein
VYYFGKNLKDQQYMLFLILWKINTLICYWWDANYTTSEEGIGDIWHNLKYICPLTQQSHFQGYLGAHLLFPLLSNMLEIFCDKKFIKVQIKREN